MTTLVEPPSHYVYIICGQHGKALYVGCTYSVAKRMAKHASGPWREERVAVLVEGPMPASKALRREDDLIWTLGPVYNRPQSRDFLDFGLCEDGATPIPGWTGEPLPEPCYSLPRAALLTGANQRTIRDAIAAGELRVIRRAPGRRVIPASSLMRWSGRTQQVAA